MPDPSPLDRRVWRLGFLLTGNPDAAASLISRIRRSGRDPARLEPALLDRFIIQNARSLPRASSPLLPATAASTPATLAAAEGALSATLRLSRQPQEAWILKRLDDLDDLHIARAMDCSKTAARTHLSAADESMSLRLADRLAPSIAALRDYADSIDPAPLIAAARERSRRQRSQRIVFISLAAGAVILIAAFITLKILTST